MADKPQWRRGPPDSTGWYWIYEPNANGYIATVEVERFSDGAMFADVMGGALLSLEELFDNGEWHLPLTAPNPPEDA